MNLSKRRLRWHPTTVFWASLAVMTIIVVTFGIIASHQIITSMGEKVLTHAAEHNKDIARRLTQRMQEIQNSTANPQQILDRFQNVITHSESFGTAVLLIDVKSGQVLAHSDRQIAQHQLHITDLLHSPVNLAGDASHESPWHGVLKAVSYDDKPVLLYSSRVVDTDALKWVLAVESDITHLISSIDEQATRVDLILLLTDTLIALLGFFALRHIGRGYEASLEKQLQQRTDELQAAHKQMLRKACLATIGQTATMLTHEMRNPLAAIKLGLSGLNTADYLQQRERRRIDIVVNEVDRLDELLSQTLDYARPIKLSDEPVQLDSLLDQVLEVIQPLMDRKSLQLDRSECQGCPPVRLDMAQMQQALFNVLKNAIEASPSGSAISINCRRSEQRLEIVVTNQGPPIAAEQLQQLFELFYTTKSHGTGLGLSLVKRVIEEHQGSVEIESDAEIGTRVTLFLPV